MDEEYPLNFQEINPNPKQNMEVFRNNPSPIVLLLDGLDDPKNLGSIFRLADACRIPTIYGFNFRETLSQSKIDRISRQTTAHIMFKHLNKVEEIVKLAKVYSPIALEYTNKSIPFKGYKKGVPCMLIIGNERRGVSKDLLQIADSSLHVPMLGNNSSMNVSVATGIVLYHLLDQMKLI